MTFKLGFCTDIHLNFVSEKQIKIFAKEILSNNLDALAIAGDISEAPTVEEHLVFLHQCLENKFPVFFVLGNHDYYNGSIHAVRTKFKNGYTYTELHKNTKSPRLGWLSSSGVIPLTDKHAIIGHDGWYDGQYANWFASKIFMNDYVVIEELAVEWRYSKQDLFNKLNNLAFEAAQYVKTQLELALKQFEHVYVVTHVPPYPENATYNGKISDSHWMPNFSSKHMGDAILEVAKEYPDKKITVLCGHSHGFADNVIRSNLRCITGEAEYRDPKLNIIFKL